MSKCCAQAETTIYGNKLFSSRLPFFFCGSTVLLDPGRLTYRRFFELFRHMVGLLGRVISPSQGLYLHRTTQRRKTRTNIHDLSGIRTHDPSNQPAKTHASDRTATVTYLPRYKSLIRIIILLYMYRDRSQIRININIYA
jgi:hypothetical protein